MTSTDQPTAPEVRVHPSWEKAGGIALAIMQGKHDDELDFIAQACKQRLKSRFRKGTVCTLTGTKSVDLEGKSCVIIKVNQKSITVGVGKVTVDQWGTTYEGGEYNVSPKLLVAS